MKGSSADFHVVGLQNHTAALGPVALQRENQVLKSQGLDTYLAGLHRSHVHPRWSARVYARALLRFGCSNLVLWNVARCTNMGRPPGACTIMVRRRDRGVAR